MTKRSRATALALSTVLGLMLLSPARADDGYGFDLSRRHKAAFRAWRKVVPAKYRRVRWINNLDGTAGPIHRVELKGRVYLSGTVCEPHDCGANTVAFLITPRGEVAYGLLRSDNEAPGGEVWFGTAIGIDVFTTLHRIIEGEQQ